MVRGRCPRRRRRDRPAWPIVVWERQHRGYAKAAL